MKAYYEARAAEYDEWYLGTGRFAARDRAGWQEELAALEAAIRALPPARSLDVACGTGFLTRQLRGEVTGLDQSPAMVAAAAERLPHARFVTGDAIPLCFDRGQFDRVFTGHFYGHLQEPDRLRFLAGARHVAGELVIVDSALRPGVEPEEWQERILNDGSRYEVYKRYFAPETLLEELGGGEVLFAGTWFVMVQA